MKKPSAEQVEKVAKEIWTWMIPRPVTDKWPHDVPECTAQDCRDTARAAIRTWERLRTGGGKGQKHGK